MKTLLLALAFSAAGLAAHAAPPPADPAHAQACAQLKALNAKEKGDVQALEDKIKPAQGQLKPLEEQRKALAEQYRAQREALMDQITPGAGAARKSFDDQVKALGDQEQQELKAIRDKYAATRKGLKAPSADLRCR